MHHVLVPAYGRDFRSAKDAKAALLAGKDFVLTSPRGDTYANLDSFAHRPADSLQVRFDRHRRVTVFKVATLLRARACAAAASTTRMKQVDKLVQEKVGLSYLDLRDIDYAGLYESGSSPKDALDELMNTSRFGRALYRARRSSGDFEFFGFMVLSGVTLLVGLFA